MVNLLKSFGKGILYVIGLPFFLLALLLYGIYGIFLFLFMLLKGIILFFTGRSLFEDLPEDRKAKEILHPTPKVEEKPQISEQPTPTKVEEKAPQKEPEIIPTPFIEKEPEPINIPEDNDLDIEPEPESVEEDQNVFDDEETKVQEDDEFLPNFLDKEEPMPINKPEEKKEEIIEKYTPKTSVFDDLDTDDDEPYGGVRIERSDK